MQINPGGGERGSGRVEENTPESRKKPVPVKAVKVFTQRTQRWLFGRPHVPQGYTEGKLEIRGESRFL
jgi:hypothetical protein